MVTPRAPSGKKTATGTEAKKPASSKAGAATAASKKPVAKKVVAAKPAAKKAAAKTGAATDPARKTAAKRVGASSSAQDVATKGKPGNKDAKKMTVSPEERYQMIAAAAYWRAERRNFTVGGALDDWIAAEAEIDAKLGL